MGRSGNQIIGEKRVGIFLPILVSIAVRIAAEVG